MKISVCFNTCSRPILARIVLEQIKKFLDKYDYEFVIAYDRDDENPVDETIDLAKKLFTVKDVIINKDHRKHGPMFNESFGRCDGDYYMFLEDDWYWREDRLSTAMVALEEVDFVRLLRIPFHSFKNVREGYYLMWDDADYGFNFGPSIRKTRFPIGEFGTYPDRPMFEGESSRIFKRLGKTSAVLDTDSFSHVGFCDANGGLRHQHFVREGVEPSISGAIRWFKSITNDENHIDLFIEHLKKEVKKFDVGVN